MNKMAKDRRGVDVSSVHPLGQRGLADATLAEFTTRWIMQVADVADIERYATDNDRLRRRAKSGRRIVFLGDSITAFWGDLQAMAPAGLELVNRGIAGQGTVQLLLRIQEDVVDIQPDVMVLTVGANDIRAFVGSASSAGRAAIIRIARNIRSLTDIAKAHGIGVAIGSVTPVCDTSDRAQTVHRDLDQIKALNVWLRAFAKRSGFVYLDYHAALSGSDGALHPALTEDGLHPNPEGYARMEKVLKASGVLEI